MILALLLAVGPMVLPSPDVRAQMGPHVTGPGAALFCPLTTNANCSGADVVTTRATAVPCQQADGTWGTAGVDTACVGPSGLEAFGAVTNEWLHSADVDQMQTSGSPTITEQPDGSWLIVDDNAGAAESITATSALSLGDTATASCWVKPGTSSTVLLGVDGNTFCAIPIAGQDWRRITCTRTVSTAASPGFFAPATVAGTGSAYVQQCQLEVSSIPGRRCDAGASAATCAADVHQVSTAGWPVTQGRISVVYVPSHADASGNEFLWDTRVGGSVNGCATWRRGEETVQAECWDATGAVGIAVSNPLTWNAPHTIETAWTATMLRVFVDGEQVAASAINRPILGIRATAFIGSAIDGSSQANGSLRLLSVRK